jgi:lysophospholipase L1-like esterase
MKSRIQLYTFLLVFLYQFSYSQNTTYTWWNPENSDFPVIEGQAWHGEVESFYDRLPKRAEKDVRKPVWGLSKHAAGLVIRFRSNATEIKVRYGVGGNFAMDHMPATGVSGLDLYAKNGDGQLHWLRGHRSFGDTVKYDFKNILQKEKHHDLGREYQLYLPLYNSVQWMEIGVEDGAVFEVSPLRQEKPIVVYGTSIAQGACASRPGMAWTSILGRNMDRPLINLGFSGNGRLEPELIDLLAEIDAKIYVLDCLPNLGPNEDRSVEEVEKKILAAVKTLKEKRPNTPILLVEHSGYSEGSLNPERSAIPTKLNAALQKTFLQLKSDGVTGLYRVTRSELNLRLDDYVDGTHPSDLGMQAHAEACEKSLRKILNEPMGTISTTIPVTQRREPHLYDWEKRHQELLKMNKVNPPKTSFFANSIIHYWASEPKAPIARGTNSWKKFLDPLKVQNHGFGWDRVENVLWRVYHDELDGLNLDHVIIAIGTNNFGLNSNEEIVIGLESLVDAIAVRQPNAKIHISGIYPRRKQEERVVKLNLMIAQMADLKNINFTNPGAVLLDENGTIDESLFTDGLHPNKEGYEKLAPLIAVELK